MNTHSAPASGSDFFYASRPAERLDDPAMNCPRSVRTRLAPYVAFFVMVFASMAAAATVISEAPLMLVGLY
jgi:hypothetical protein